LTIYKIVFYLGSIERDDGTNNVFSERDLSLRDVDTISLYPVNQSLYPIYTNGCCGIGHRLSRVIPTIAYANEMNRKVRVHFHDVPWNVLFNDNEYVEQGYRDKGWYKALDLQLLIRNTAPNRPTQEIKKTNTTLDGYNLFRDIFHSQHILAVLVSMRDSLTPLVLSYLTPLRDQLNRAKNEKAMSICIHIREGNKEGELSPVWQKLTGRHIELDVVLNDTLAFMKGIAKTRDIPNAHIFVGSDNASVWPWFKANIPKSWTMVKPQKELQKPQKGTWIGDQGIGRTLNQTMRNEAAAEATAEMLTLGECDVLMIPTYSSFTYPAIALTKARKGLVYFSKRSSDSKYEFYEMDYLEHLRQPEYHTDFNNPTLEKKK